MALVHCCGVHGELLLSAGCLISIQESNQTVCFPPITIHPMLCRVRELRATELQILCGGQLTKKFFARKFGTT